MWFNETIQQTLDDKRLHHQLFPMSIEYEQNYDKSIVERLAKIGHNYTIAQSDGFSALTGIGRSSEVEGAYDWRRSGSVIYF